MGRQAAGWGFLRAAVPALRSHPIVAYTPSRQSFDVFHRVVKEIESTARPQWIPSNRPDLLERMGTLYLPDPTIAAAARLRLRRGPHAYSIVGVTHTTASHGAMEAITDLLTAPVMPWDALICTSKAVATTVDLLLEAQADYVKWRFGCEATVRPRLPVIPLGVHCADYEFTPDERALARRELGIGDHQIVVLYVGRLSFHAKAHPHPMYVGLEAATQATGATTVLLQCGWFANAEIETVFKNAAARHCPSCTKLWADGRIPSELRRAWAAADIFISLSDNIQETFGLTPIEAMAAGLPVVVSDWNGYKDTVRDGIDGFRIPTWMPTPEAGDQVALAHEAATCDYDTYCAATSQLTSIDLDALVDRLILLVESPDLRRQLGSAGAARARQSYDWNVIIEQYLMLWSELAERRKVSDAALLKTPPSIAPARLNPFVSFNHYPTHHLGGDTLVMRTGNDQSWAAIAENQLFPLTGMITSTASVEKILEILAGEQSVTVSYLSVESGLPIVETLNAVAVLAKGGIISLHARSI